MSGLVARLARRLGLIRYCIHCDGSINEMRERDRLFPGDRRIFHRQHERHLPRDGQVQGPARMDLPRQEVAHRFGTAAPSPTNEKASHPR